MVRDGQMDAGLARMPHIATLAGGLVIETGGTLLGGIGGIRRAGRRQGRGMRESGARCGRRQD